MMYGGGSQGWMAEAVEFLRDHPDVLACSPLPGPPTADGHLRSQSLPAEPYDSPAYRADSISTRHFFIDLGRFRDRIGALHASVPGTRQRWIARLDGNPLSETAEITISNAMVANGLLRVEFLGRGSGMWSLHPPLRSQLFYDGLPRLVSQIEAGDVPDAQRGDHELNDSMIDWSSARKPRWARWAKHFQMLARNSAARLRGA